VKFKDWPKLPLVMIAAMLVLAAVLYPSLPAQIPVHWGINGVDRWETKSLATVFQPALIASALYLLLMFAPYIDPKRRNLLQSKQLYSLIVDMAVALMLVVEIGEFAAAFRHNLPVDRVILLGTSAMFVVIGNFIGRVKQNWTMGARLPWTLEDPEVWRKTNRLTGRMFVVAGVLGAIGVFLPTPWPIVMLIVPSLALVPVLYVYAYLLYRRRHPDEYRDAEA